MLSIQDVFDSNYYLAQNPDVAAAVNQGAFANAFAHFSAFGKNENREISIFFKASYYLDKNQDVAAAVNNKQTTAIDHFLTYGQFEDRNSSEFFDSKSYRRKNQDVDNAIKGSSGSGKLTALEHFVKYGQFEQRDASDFFNTKFYLTRNQDVDNAVKNGSMTAFSHFVNYGQWEQRDSSIFFNNSFYLSQNQDVNAAVQQKQLSGIGHFIKYGKEEKRDAIALFNTAFYLSNNPDVNNVVNQGLTTAMEHFIQYGVFENRSPSAGFNGALLLANNSQIAALINQGTFANAFDYYVRSQNSLTAVTDLGKLTGIKTITDKVGGVNNQSKLFKFTLDNAASNFSIALDGSSKNINLELIKDQNNNGIIDQGDVLKASQNPGILADEINNLNLTSGNYFVRVIQPADLGNETPYILSLSPQGSIAQANKQVVKGFFDAFQQSWQNNNSTNQLFSYIDQNFKSDVQYLVIDQQGKDFSQETAAMLGYVGEYDGISGVKNFFNISNNNRTVLEFNVDKYLAEGNHVGLFGHYIYQAKGSGDKLEADWGAIVELNEGKISKYQSYEDTYMAAAGYRNKSQSFTWDTKFEGRTIHVISGTNGNDTFTGAEGFDENAIFGYKGNDTLTASSKGNDYLDGGEGNNTLIAGGGVDSFILSTDGQETIKNFKVGTDKLVLRGNLSFNQLTLSQNGADTNIKTSSNQLLATLIAVQSNQLTRADFTLEPLKTNDILDQDTNPQNVTPGTETRNAQIVTGFFASFVKTPQEFFNYVNNNFRDDVQYLVNGNQSTLFGAERKALLPHSGYYNGKNELLGAFDSLANKQVIPLDFVITKVVAEGNSVLAFGQFKFQSRATGEIFYSDLAVDMELDQSGKIAKYFFLEDSYSVVGGYRFKDTPAQNLNWNTTFNGITRNIFTGSNQNDTLSAANSTAQENFLFAYKGDDTVIGGTGNNTLDGGTGNNTLTGGAGNNRFIIQKDSFNTITNFNTTKDKLALRGDLSFDKLVITQNGSDTEISVKNSNGSSGTKLAILKGVTSSSVTAVLFSQDGVIV